MLAADESLLKDLFDALALVGSTRMPVDIVNRFFPDRGSTAPETPVDWEWFSKSMAEKPLPATLALERALGELPDAIPQNEVLSSLSGLCTAVSPAQLARVFTRLESDGQGHHGGLIDAILELRRLSKLSSPRFVRDAIVSLRTLARLPVPKALQSTTRDRGKSFRSVVDLARARKPVATDHHDDSKPVTLSNSHSAGGSTATESLPKRPPTTHRSDTSTQYEPTFETTARGTQTSTTQSTSQACDFGCQVDVLGEVADETSGTLNDTLRHEVTSLANLVQAKAEQLRVMQSQLASFANISLLHSSGGEHTAHRAVAAVHRLDIESDASFVRERLRVKEAALVRLLDLQRKENEVSERIRRLEQVGHHFPPSASNSMPTPSSPAVRTIPSDPASPPHRLSRRW